MKQTKNLIYGKHAVIEFLTNHPNMVFKVYTSHFKELVKMNLIDSKLIVNSTNSKMERMFDQNVNHQGYVAEVKEFNYLPFVQMVEELKSEQNQVVLILDQIHDPYNFGAILRSAALTGVKNIIILDHKQVMVNQTVVKTSGGVVYGLNISKVANLNVVVEKLKQIGFWVYASNLNTQAIRLDQVEFAKKSALIIGNEQKGLSSLLTKNSDLNVYIPSSKVIDSYNASVAAAIMLYTASLQLKLI